MRSKKEIIEARNNLVKIRKGQFVQLQMDALSGGQELHIIDTKIESLNWVLKEGKFEEE